MILLCHCHKKFSRSIAMNREIKRHKAKRKHSLLKYFRRVLSTVISWRDMLVFKLQHAKH